MADRRWPRISGSLTQNLGGLLGSKSEHVLCLKRFRLSILNLPFFF